MAADDYGFIVSSALDASRVVVNSAGYTFAYISKQIVTLTPANAVVGQSGVRIDLGVDDLIAVASSVPVFMVTGGASLDQKSYTVIIECGQPSATITVYRFGRAQSAPGGYGIEVYTADGKMSFSSNYTFMRVLDTYQAQFWNPAGGGANGVPVASSKGWNVGAVAYLWSAPAMWMRWQIVGNVPPGQPPSSLDVFTAMATVQTSGAVISTNAYTQQVQRDNTPGIRQPGTRGGQIIQGFAVDVTGL